MRLSRLVILSVWFANDGPVLSTVRTKTNVTSLDIKFIKLPRVVKNLKDTYSLNREYKVTISKLTITELCRNVFHFVRKSGLLSGKQFFALCC